MVFLISNSEVVVNLFSAIKNDKKFLALMMGVLIAIMFELSALFNLQTPQIVRIILCLGLISLFGREVLQKGFAALKELNFKSINLLMTLAATGALYLKEFEEAAVVIVLFALAERLEEFGFDQSKMTIKKLLDQIPAMALKKGDAEPVLVTTLKIGDIVLIKPGDALPVDGKVLEGSTSVDESSVTGEPLPRDKNIGDFVFAGTINLSGYLEVEVQKLPEHSTIAKIVELTLTATNQKSETELFIRQFSSKYTPFVLFCVFLLMTIPTLVFGQPFEKWFSEALSLLVISCPCALVISTPISIYAGMTNAAKNGLLIKGGKYLELIGKVQTVALDKTRTLTYGKPQVTDILTFSDFSKEEILACAAGLEMKSEHPLAASVVKQAQTQGLTLHDHENFHSILGKGASSSCITCNDGIHYLGRPSFIQERIPLSFAMKSQVDGLEKFGKTVILMADQKVIKGAIAFSDTIKPEAKESVDELKNLGINVVMLTGDQSKSAQLVGDAVGIKDVQASLLPQDKEKAIRILTDQKLSVAMVGDGINDAPALARASIGIAMGAAGSDIAIETASISILNDDIKSIPYLIRLGRKTLITIKFNTLIAVIVKLSFVGLALMGHGQLVLAIVADVVLTLFVILNSLRIMSFSKEI
jgi:Zn2+/Cd2+-exporting ATPase